MNMNMNMDTDMEISEEKFFDNGLLSVFVNNLVHIISVKLPGGVRALCFCLGC